MQITKQLSEDEFVIKMDERDLQTHKNLVIAHDYIGIGANMGIQTSTDEFEGNLYGRFQFCGNWIKARHYVQVGIRDVIQLMLPKLNGHEYCQPSHLISQDGKPIYTYGESKFVYYDKGVEMIALRRMGETEYTHIPRSLYNDIKNGEL